MKNKTILIFGMIFLIGFTIAFTQVNYSMSFDKETKDTLESIGISEPVIGSCIRINDNVCKSKVYQKGGINKDIEIIYHYCNNYSVGEEDDFDFVSECIEWITLSQEEIETEMKIKTEELFNSIANIQNQRNKEAILMTNEIKIEMG